MATGLELHPAHLYIQEQVFTNLQNCSRYLAGSVPWAVMSELPGIPEPEHIPGRSSALRAADSECGATTGCSGL